jgi:nucleoside 2-deoxyribosyltransferase
MTDKENSQETCPICGCIHFKVVRSNEWPDASYEVECRICGTYHCEKRFLYQSEPDSEKNHLLSAVVRESWEKRKTPLRVDFTTAVDLVKGREVSRLNDKILLLLRRLEKNTEYFGQRVCVNFKHDYPIAYCKNEKEFRSLFELLEERKLIIDSAPNGFCSLSAEAHEFLDQNRPTLNDSPMAFVAMWFDDSVEEIYDTAISPAINSCGYDCKRIDYVEHNQKIDDLIINYLKECRFVVADFTGHRPSVYFEAGYALALGKPVIWLCHEDHIEDCHFDTRQYNHIVWKDPEELREKLERRILAVVGRRG